MNFLTKVVEILKKEFLMIAYINQYKLELSIKV